jgi:hypothetical protein
MHFNEKTVILTCRQGVQSYGVSGPAGLALDSLIPITTAEGDPDDSIPDDMTSPVELQFKIGDVWRLPIVQKDISYIRSVTYNEGNWGYPDVYAWYARQIHLYQIPLEDMLWRLDYVFDVDRPRYRIDGGVFVFEHEVFYPEGATLPIPPGGTAPEGGLYLWESIPATYTNPWLDNADLLVVNRAWWDLEANYFGNQDKAIRAWAAFKDSLGTIETESFNLGDGNMGFEPSL